MKKSLIITAVAAGSIALCSTMALAGNRAGTFAISPVVGGYTFDGEQNLEPSLLFGLRAGYNITKAIGVEGVFHTAPSVEDDNNLIDAKMLNYRLEALYHFLPDNRFVPFLAAGYGVTRLKFDGQDAMNGGAFDYGFGAKYFLNDKVALRGDARQLVIDRGPTYYNYEYTLGLAYMFGGSKAAPKAAEPAPEPAVVKPAPPPAPTSSLTVFPATVAKGNPATLSWSSTNTTDCSIVPGIGGVQTEGSLSVTPPESTNYSLSCTGAGGSTASKTSLAVTQPALLPVDTDKDGVLDTLDKCPGTPLGVKVDTAGCPLDADKDGVADYLDKCPGTPVGVKVDAVGCPLDADKDGVADYLDKCPGTPVGVKVDAAGCPLDSDRDGVADYMDKCPDTPTGAKVNKDGCPPPPPSACKSITLEVEFDTAKADVKPLFDKEIKKVADMLKENPGSTAVIEGHTDNVGAADMNLKLSDRRANSVRNYLIEKFGVAADRLTAKGYGLTKPRASNKTAEGRHENRRVEAVIYCDGTTIKATDHDTHH